MRKHRTPQLFVSTGFCLDRFQEGRCNRPQEMHDTVHSHGNCVSKRRSGSAFCMSICHVCEAQMRQVQARQRCSWACSRRRIRPFRNTSCVEPRSIGFFDNPPRPGSSAAGCRTTGPPCATRWRPARGCLVHSPSCSRRSSGPSRSTSCPRPCSISRSDSLRQHLRIGAVGRISPLRSCHLGRNGVLFSDGVMPPPGPLSRAWHWSMQQCTHVEPVSRKSGAC
mmetsp:Transcript_45713/g.129312  ORF Transcript_45713/g.129312 Transcript_45713/m.129312 type:complete len:223 (-) Transcript_45713:180-848(-)